MTEVAFDESAIATTIDTYIADSVNTEKYELVSINVKNKTLTLIETDVCLRVEAEMELLTKKDQVPLNILVTLLVYPE